MIALSKLDKNVRIQINFGDTEDVSEKVQIEINRQLEIFGSILRDQIIPELKNNNIIFYYKTEIRNEHIPEIRDFRSALMAAIACS